MPAYPTHLVSEEKTDPRGYVTTLDYERLDQYAWSSVKAPASDGYTKRRELACHSAATSSFFNSAAHWTAISNPGLPDARECAL